MTQGHVLEDECTTRLETGERRASNCDQHDGERDEPGSTALVLRREHLLKSGEHVPERRRRNSTEPLD